MAEEPVIPRDLLERREYLLDPSLLDMLPAVRDETPLVLLVPKTLDALLSAPESTERDSLIVQLVRSSRAGPRILTLSVQAGRYLAPAAIPPAYARLKLRGALRVIPDEEARSELRHALAGVVRERRQDLSVEIGDLRLTRASVIRRHVDTILEHSHRTGTAILMCGRQLVAKLAGRVATLELPGRLDRLVDTKQQTLGRLFHFPGGRALRFFVGVVISAAGFSNNPVIGVAGLLFTFVDP